MGSKNQPGAFDCYANAKPDEPMFVLLGRDRSAGLLVRLWANMREQSGEDPAKIANARKIADDLDAWAVKLGKSPMKSVYGAACKSCDGACVVDGALCKGCDGSGFIEIAP